MKVLKGLSRVIFTILMVVFMLVGVLCILIVSPAITVTAEVPLINTLTVSALGLPPFLGLFGGESNELVMSVSTYLNGELLNEVVTEGILGEFVFDYATFIGLIVGLVGSLLVIFLWRKKWGCLLGSGLTLIGTVLVALQGVFFDALNGTNLDGVFDSLPGLGNLLNMNSMTVPVGGIICAVMFGLIFLIGFIHGLIEKAKK